MKIDEAVRDLKLETTKGRSSQKNIVLFLIVVMSLAVIWLWFDHERQQRDLASQQESIKSMEQQLVGVTADTLRQAEMILGTNHCAMNPQNTLCMNAKRTVDRFSDNGAVVSYMCTEDNDLILTYSNGSTSRSAAACVATGEGDKG